MSKFAEVINSLKNGNYKIETDVYGVGLTADPLDQLMPLCDEDDSDTWFYEIGYYVAEPTWKSSGAYIDIAVNVCGHTFKTSAFGTEDEYLEWTTDSDMDIDDDLVDALNAKVHIPEDFSEWFNIAFPTKEAFLKEIDALKGISPKGYFSDGWTLCFRKKIDAPQPQGWLKVSTENLYDEFKKHI